MWKTKTTITGVFRAGTATERPLLLLRLVSYPACSEAKQEALLWGSDKGEVKEERNQQEKQENGDGQLETVPV